MHLIHINVFIDKREPYYICPCERALQPRLENALIRGNKNGMIWRCRNWAVIVPERETQWQVASHFCRDVDQMCSSLAVTFSNFKCRGRALCNIVYFESFFKKSQCFSPTLLCRRLIVVQYFILSIHIFCLGGSEI